MAQQSKWSGPKPVWISEYTVPILIRFLHRAIEFAWSGALVNVQPYSAICSRKCAEFRDITVEVRKNEFLGVSQNGCVSFDDSDSKRKKQPKSAASSNKAVDEHAKRFPVQMIHDVLLVRKFTSGTVKKEAAVFLTAVMEYLSCEILELTANVARNRSNSQDEALKVIQAGILEAVETDHEMKELIVRVKKINSDGEK
ncbi:hypothetical protein AVEN_212892-1 [Araneus ventricosus]|uniref:Histone H2A n=1 Tax=Araneus ventricosus TaxID=182803 RepID=A0A4Y2F693_ARAVE|nr:hypothetical protein AVEN_212892-1 [Araneus ventricosus]